MANYNELKKIITTIYGRTDDISWDDIYEMSKVFIYNTKPGQPLPANAILAMGIIRNVSNITICLNEELGLGNTANVFANNGEALADTVADFIYRGHAKDTGVTVEMLDEAGITRPMNFKELL